MTEDILARIDEALGCQQCGKKLRENGPSPDFCGESCQWLWHAARASRHPHNPDRATLLHDAPGGRGYSADVVIVDEVTTLTVDEVTEFAEQVAGVRLDGWQRGWPAQWFRRHR